MGKLKITFKDIPLLATPILVGIISILIWWYELHQVVGWQGMGWLREDLKAVYIITFLVVLTFLLPLIVELKMPAVWVLAYGLALFVASLMAFFAAKQMFHTLYTRGLVLGDETLIAFSIWKLLGIVIALGIVYFIPMRHFLRTTDGMHILTIMVAII